MTREAWRTPVEEPWGVDLEWRSGPDASAFGLALAFVELVGVEAARSAPRRGSLRRSPSP